MCACVCVYVCVTEQASYYWNTYYQINYSTINMNNVTALIVY